MKTEVNTLETRVARAQAVSDYIMKNEKVGSLDNPSQWIYGQQEVQSGFMGDDNEVVVWGGSVIGITFLLAGSSKNVTGFVTAKDDVSPSLSYLPSLLFAMRCSEMTLEQGLLQKGGNVDDLVKMQMTSSAVPHATSCWFDTARWAWMNFDGPIVTIEFLARQLLFDGKGDDMILIASPIYVARIE
jgi:hypothetical protein